MNLTINNGTGEGLDFSASSAWDDWQEETIDVILSGGLNAIRLTATQSGGAPNMDKMDITIYEGEVVTPTPTPSPTPTPTPTPDPTDVPPDWTPPPFQEREFDVDVPMGWAVVQRHGLEGTTGGGGG